MFSRKQLEILAFPDSDYDALICDGAIRTGKTMIMSVAFLTWGMRDFNGVNFGICSKTLLTADRNVVQPLLAMSYIQERFAIKYVTYSYMQVTAFGHTNIFYLYGGRDSSSYTSIQGVTLAGVFLDEVALMPRSFVEQALARCSVAGRKFWFNCNPEGQLHWFNQEWILEAKKHNALHLHLRLDDNPALPDSIKQGYRDMYSGVFYDRYIEGLWVSAEGVIYDEFDRSDHVLSEEQVNALEYEEYVIISSDYGIQNATTFLPWRKIRGQNSWVCVDEYYYSGREEHKQKSVSELVEGLDELVDRVGAIVKLVIIDPSAAALIVEARKKGYRTREADNNVINGIADVQNMLKDRRILFSERCKHTLEEFGEYRWDEKAAQKGEDKPIKENDHCMDAVRYFVHTQKLARKPKNDVVTTNLLYL